MSFAQEKMDEHETLRKVLREKLRSPLPADAIKQHPTKTYMSSVNSAYVIERLNDVFGESGWNAEYTVIEASPQSAMVVVQCVLHAGGIRRQTFGGNDNKDRGDAYKGACTDALTKAASQIGIAQDVYKGMHDVPKEDEEPGKKRKPRVEKEKYELVDGIVTKEQRMGQDALWLEVNGNRLRAVDPQTISKLAGSNGKRVEVRCRWDSYGKNKVPVLTITHVQGLYTVVPGHHYEPDDLTDVLTESVRQVQERKAAPVQGVPVAFK